MLQRGILIWLLPLLESRKEPEEKKKVANRKKEENKPMTERSVAGKDAARLTGQKESLMQRSQSCNWQEGSSHS